MKEDKFLVSSSPHITDKESIPRMMYGIVLSLIPSALGSIYFFGYHAGFIILIAIIAAVASEAILDIVLRKKTLIKNGRVVVIGMLLGFCLPPHVPWWIPVIGSSSAIAICKIPFRKLGYNPMNPVLLGWAILFACFPAIMSSFIMPPRGGTMSGIDAITSATPLTLFNIQRDHLARYADNPTMTDNVETAHVVVTQLYDSYGNLFYGRIGGCIGETSALLLLLGAVYLLYKRYINLRIPFSYIITVGILTWIFSGIDGFFSGDPLFHLLSGGLILGAFYIATDTMTSPITPLGRYIFGAGCGAFTFVFRLYSGLPEGVCYAILLMNLLVPLIDRYTRPKRWGANS